MDDLRRALAVADHRAGQVAVGQDDRTQRVSSAFRRHQVSKLLQALQSALHREREEAQPQRDIAVGPVQLHKAEAGLRVLGHQLDETGVGQHKSAPGSQALLHIGRRARVRQAHRARYSLEPLKKKELNK